MAARLAGGVPYVIRFRAPDDAAGQRVRFTDAIRGELEQDANRNDAVILKSAGPSPRLPTYHLAHAVDDHLMRVTLVIRGEEWISSVPLHRQLFGALGFEPVRYAHIALLMKPIPGGKRKLSKRKIRKRASTSTSPPGIRADAIAYYLRGLANGRLAELPLSQALAAPIRLDQMGVAGPLVDLAKLEDISADHIATLTSRQVFDAVRAWAVSYDPSWSPCSTPTPRWPCGPWPWSAKAPRTRARTYANGPTSGLLTVLFRPALHAAVRAGRRAAGPDRSGPGRSGELRPRLRRRLPAPG